MVRNIENDELLFILNTHFAKYEKMVRDTKVNDLYYDWSAWCDDVVCGHMGGKRQYENCDSMVYEYCMSNHYLVMTN